MNRVLIGALSLSVAAFLAGCGGSPPSAMPQVPSQGAPVAGGRLAVAGGPSTQDYLYASDELGQVYIYTYPQGQFVTSLIANTYSGGECADSQGNVFVTTANSQFQSTIWS